MKFQEKSRDFAVRNDDVDMDIAENWLANQG